MRTKNSKPNASWNTSDLRAWIERHTESARRAVQSYMERRRLGDINPTADKNILKLQKATGQKRIGLSEKIASLTRKRKSELLKQAEALSKFETSEKRSKNWTQKTKRKSKKQSNFDRIYDELFGNTKPDIFKMPIPEPEPEPEPQPQPFESDEKKRRAYESFNKNYGGEEGISPELYQRFIDTIGSVDFENYNVESNYVVQNIIEQLDNGFSTKDILDAWDFAFKTEKAGESTYDKVVRVDMFLKDDIVEVDDGVWMSRETGEIFNY